MGLKLSAVMFAYNEGEHLEGVVRETLGDLVAHTDAYQLVVVDDGSTDDTPAILARLSAEEPHLTVVTHPENRGIGEAVHTGYAAAELDWICILPADGQIKMSEYVHLFAAAESGADLVLGRYRQRHEVDGLGRMILSRGLRGMMWVLLGVGRHLDSAFLFRRELLDALPLTSRTFFVNLELPVRIIREGYRVDEAPIDVFPRISGHSKVVKLKQIAGVGAEVLKLRMQLWREARSSGRSPHE